MKSPHLSRKPRQRVREAISGVHVPTRLSKQPAPMQRHGCPRAGDEHPATHDRSRSTRRSLRA